MYSIWIIWSFNSKVNLRISASVEYVVPDLDELARDVVRESGNWLCVTKENINQIQG